MNAAVTAISLVVLFSVIFAVLLLVTMWRAWWLYPAWGWFVVPLGLPAIGFWHFAGLLFLVTIVTMHNDSKKDDRKTDWVSLVVKLFFPILFWALLRWMSGHV